MPSSFRFSGVGACVTGPDAAGGHILDAPPLAVLLIGPLALIGGDGAAPKEAPFWKFHVHIHSSLSLDLKDGIFRFDGTGGCGVTAAKSSALVTTTGVTVS